MIARVWHGVTRPGADADAYLSFVTGEVLAGLPEIPGYGGAQVLRQTKDDGIEFTVITLWDSLDAIRAFAGEDAERAVVEPEARALLIAFEERVHHAEVAWAAWPSAI